MKILLITQFFAPDITAAAFRLTDFARLLVKRDHEVQVITAYPHKAQVEAIDDAAFESEGIQISRCHIQDVVGSGARAYLTHYMSFVRGSIRQGWKIWRTGWRPDVIYVSSPPLLVGMTGRFLAALFRRPWVMEIRDIWPDTPVAAGQLSQDGRAYKIGRKMEKYFYRKANRLICVSQPMSEYLAEETRTPVTVIYNGVSLEDAEAERQNPEKTLNSKTILYAGNLGHLQELELLIQGFSEVCRNPELADWKLHLLGAGAQLEMLKQLVQELDLKDQVVFHSAVSREDAMRMMQDCGLLYLNLKLHPTLAKTIPSKLFDYFLAGRPIVAGLAGEGRQLLESTQANVVFNPGNVDELKQAIATAITNSSNLEQNAHLNRELVLKRFTRDTAVDQLESVFQEIIK